MVLPPLLSTLFPYTTLFRSRDLHSHGVIAEERHLGEVVEVDVPAVLVHLIQQLLEDDGALHVQVDEEDRKSTRLNSSHVKSSYAVFCLKKKKENNKNSIIEK